MTSEELLNQLNGLKTLENASWLPLAPGWWFLALVIAAVISGCWFFRRHRKTRQFYQICLEELYTIELEHSSISENTEFVQALSRWLRQVSLLALTDLEIASLTGKKWLEFLDSILQGTDFTRGDGEVFGAMVYSKQPEINRPAILMLCQRWLVQIDLIQKQQQESAAALSEKPADD